MQWLYRSASRITSHSFAGHSLLPTSPSCEAITLLARFIAQCFSRFNPQQKILAWAIIKNSCEAKGPFVYWGDVTSIQFEKSHESRLWLVALIVMGSLTITSCTIRPRRNLQATKGFAIVPQQFPILHYKWWKHCESILITCWDVTMGCLEFSKNNEWMYLNYSFI